MRYADIISSVTQIHFVKSSLCVKNKLITCNRPMYLDFSLCGFNDISLLTEKFNVLGHHLVTRILTRSMALARWDRRTKELNKDNMVVHRIIQHQESSLLPLENFKYTHTHTHPIP